MDGHLCISEYEGPSGDGGRGGGDPQGPCIEHRVHGHSLHGPAPRGGREGPMQQRQGREVTPWRLRDPTSLPDSWEPRTEGPPWGTENEPHSWEPAGHRPMWH